MRGAGKRGQQTSQPNWESRCVSRKRNVCNGTPRPSSASASSARYSLTSCGVPALLNFFGSCSIRKKKNPFFFFFFFSKILQRVELLSTSDSPRRAFTTLPASTCRLPRALILCQFHRALLGVRPAQGHQPGFSLFCVLSHPSRTFLLSSPMSAPLLEVLISNNLTRPNCSLIFQKILFFLSAEGLVVPTSIATT
jgi:hypothetical protein